MRKSISFGILVAAFAAIAVSANAITIDNFTEGPDSLMVVSANTYIEGQESGFNIAGQQRDVLLWSTTNPYSQPITFSVSPGQGASFFNAGAASSGYVQLDYDGFDVEAQDGVQTQASPGMNLNLSTQAGLLFTFLSADSPVRVDVTAITYGATPAQNGVSTYTFTTAGNISAATTYTALFTNFSVGVGAPGQFNPADVDRFNFRFTPTNPAGDFTLQNISTAPVPEPASMAALGIGALGLLRLRRRNKK